MAKSTITLEMSGKEAAVLKSCLNNSELFIYQTEAYDALRHECLKIVQHIWEVLPDTDFDWYSSR